MTTTMLVLSALTSTHLVAWFVATKMYLLLVNHHAILISARKFNPHFINGSYGKFVFSLAKLYVVTSNF